MPSPTEALISRTIQTGRYSDQVARQIVRGYAINVGAAADRVHMVSEGRVTLAKATSLLSEALQEWEDESLETTSQKMVQYGRVESRFTGHQLERLRAEKIEKPTSRAIQTVAVTPEWANAVVNSRPGQLPPLPRAGTHTLGRADGRGVALPGKGQILRTQYRRISEDTVSAYNNVVRTGLLQGTNPNEISRQLVGRVKYDRPALRISELQQAQGQLWRAAPTQIRTLTRTSFNQIQNQITSRTYAANQDIFPYYFYMATLDDRTSIICASYDGQKFKHGEGPIPPLHFNCRSTTVPATKEDKEALPERAYRDEDGKTRLTQGMSYGSWLAEQSNTVQSAVLGPSRAGLFRQATADGAPAREVLTSFLRKDGSEASLGELSRLDVFDD